MVAMSFGMRLVRRLLLAMMCVFTVASVVQPQLHDLLVEHVFCAEHQALEHDSLDADTHGETCTFPGSLAGPPSLGERAPRIASEVDLPSVVPLTGGSAPRAPPLSFAPKTSPPTPWI